MNKIWIGVAAAVGFVAGTAAGWFLRKRTEIEFVETTEEDQMAYAAKCEQEAAEKKEEDGDEDDESAQTSDETYGEAAEGTNVNPAMDTRKIDYANQWKRDEIKKKMGYGEPTPGDPEDLSVSEADLDPGFLDEIKNEGPRFIPIGPNDFYKADKDVEREFIFWYDRDDVMTRLKDDDEEEVLDNPDKFIGFDIKAEYEKAKADEELEKEIGSDGVRFFREDTEDGKLILVTRYPSSYNKRKQQEEFGGTDYIEWMHRRNGMR